MYPTRRLVGASAAFAVFAGALGLAARAQATTASFRLIDERGLALKSPCSIAIRPVLASPDSEPVELPCPQTGAGEFALPLEPPFSVSVQGPGLWSDVRVSHEIPAELRLYAFRTAPVAFSEQPQAPRPGDTPVARAVVSVPGGGELLRGSVECQHDSNQLVCELPGRRLDLRLEARDFAPIYLWSLEIGAAGFSPPTLAWAPGASIATWIEGPSDLEPASIRLEATPPLPAPATVVCPPSLEVSPGSGIRCFAQVPSTPPGEYVIRAVAAGGLRSASARAEVVRPEESLLTTPLRLVPPLSASFSLSPPTHPSGVAWAGELSEVIGGGVREEAARSAPASAEGLLRFSDLAPGSYELAVLGPGGSVVARKAYELVDRPLDEALALDYVEVEGQVICNGTPLDGNLVAGGTFGRSAITLTTGEEGRFHGFLPPSRYERVTFRSREASAADLELGPLDLSDRPPLARESLEWLLPDTAVLVRVEDASGEPVPEASVNLVSPERRQREWSGTTDEDGEVAARCLRPGALLAAAFRGRDRTGWRSATLEEGRELELVLILEQTVEIRGRIESEGRGIGAARIEAFPRALVNGGAPATRRAISEPTGDFVLEVPEGPVDLLAHAPGYATSLLRVDARESPRTDLRIPLDSIGGTLFIDPPPVPGDSRVLRHAGAEVGLGVLYLMQLQRLGAAISVDSPLVSLRLESGNWSLCPGAAQPALECVHATLGRWGSSTLALERQPRAARGNTKEAP